MDAPIICAGVVVVEGERILLIRRGHAPDAGRWSLPGGRALVGEAPQDTACREAWEETGLQLEIGELLGTAAIVGAGRVRYLVSNFAATRSATQQPRAGSDATEARFFELGELGALDLSGGLFDWFVAHGIVSV